MDRDRFRSRSRELTDLANEFEQLAKITDRATPKDLQKAARLMAAAASDLDDLINATPPGCICRLIEREDSSSYLIYAEACRHHGRYYHLSETLKKQYAALEKKLKDEVRMRVVLAALSGSVVADPALGGDILLVRSALAIADEVIRQMTEEIT